jgi:hypothetical protein
MWLGLNYGSCNRLQSNYLLVYGLRRGITITPILSWSDMSIYYIYPSVKW